MCKERVDGNQTRLEISAKGSQWLASPLEEQYKSVYGLLNFLPSKKSRSSYDQDYTFESSYLAGAGIHSIRRRR